MFNDDNVTKPQTLTAALTPIRACEEEDPVAPAFESPLRKKPRFRESIADRLSETAPGHFECKYDEKELVGFTHPSLMDVIPWNMAEPSFRQELQCIREAEHL